MNILTEENLKEAIEYDYGELIIYLTYYDDIDPLIFINSDLLEEAQHIILEDKKSNRSWNLEFLTPFRNCYWVDLSLSFISLKPLLSLNDLKYLNLDYYNDTNLEFLDRLPLNSLSIKNKEKDNYPPDLFLINTISTLKSLDLLDFVLTVEYVQFIAAKFPTLKWLRINVMPEIKINLGYAQNALRRATDNLDNLDVEIILEDRTAVDGFRQRVLEIYGYGTIKGIDYD